MRVLMVGDVVGRGGRRALGEVLPKLKDELSLDFVCVQGENAAGGFGLNPKVIDEIFEAGASVITSGNHIWDKLSVIPVLKEQKLPVLRPLNYSKKAPGMGAIELEKCSVINLISTDIAGGTSSPYDVVEELLDSGFSVDKPIIVDFHAEMTSEKNAMGWLLDGRVSMVVGTHTHVPTADSKILPNKTAYTTDLGMVGGLNSVLGMNKDTALVRLQTGVKERFTPVEKGTFQFNSVMVEIDEQTNLAKKVTRIDRFCEV